MTQKIRRRDGSMFEAADDYILRDGERCAYSMVLMDGDKNNAHPLAGVHRPGHCTIGTSAEQQARIDVARTAADNARDRGIQRVENAWKTPTAK